MARLARYERRDMRGITGKGNPEKKYVKIVIYTSKNGLGHTCYYALCRVDHQRQVVDVVFMVGWYAGVVVGMCCFRDAQ